jgi:hypothetical protein
MYYCNAQHGIPGRLCGGETFICLPVILVTIFPTSETVLPSGNASFCNVSTTCRRNVLRHRWGLYCVLEVYAHYPL